MNDIDKWLKIYQENGYVLDCDKIETKEIDYVRYIYLLKTIQNNEYKKTYGISITDYHQYEHKGISVQIEVNCSYIQNVPKVRIFFNKENISALGEILEYEKTIDIFLINVGENNAFKFGKKD